MTLINFEIIKLKKQFQLEISLELTFLQLAELIFDNFNLEQFDFSSDKSLSPLFIYKCIVCKYERTIKSYQIDNQSIVYIFIPNQIYQAFITAFKNRTSTAHKPKLTRNLTKSTNLFHSTGNSFSKILFDRIRSGNTPLKAASSSPNINHSLVLRHVDPNLLKSITDCGYDEISAAYALAYKITIKNAIDFLNLGLPASDEVRYYISKIIEAKLCNNLDEEVLNSLEVIRIEAEKCGKIPELSVAAAIGIFASQYKVSNRIYPELFEFLRKVDMKYPGQVSIMVQMELAANNITPNINQLYGQFQGQNHFNQNQLYDQNQFNSPNLNHNQLYTQNLNQSQFVPNNKLQYYDTKSKFFSLFNSLGSMTRQNYVNPFEETYNDMVSMKHQTVDEQFYNFGRKLDYDQLMFLYRMLKERNVDLNVSMQYLNASNGNINDAEALINSN